MRFIMLLQTCRMMASSDVMAITKCSIQAPSSKKSRKIAAPPRQEFALNLSAKRRLCNTVGKRFIDGIARCCAVSIARSRAAATTNFACSNQSLALRFLFAGAKSFAPVNVCMSAPYRLVISRPRPNSAPGSRPSHGFRDPVLRFGSQSKGKETLTRPTAPSGGGSGGMHRTRFQKPKTIN
jgi:hypothetical protein